MKFSYSILLVFALVFFTGSLFAQKLEVIDYATKEPIAGVHIYTIDEKRSTTTDSLGTCDISEFSNDDLMVFSHTSYTQVLFKKQDLYTSRYKLELHPTILNLEEFVISANKRIQAREEVPNKLVSITAKDIKLKDPQTSADLIASSGEVFVQKSQMGGGSPMIRGFSANKVLIVVDGVRMNNAIFRGGNLQNVISIDPNIVEKSEVVFGPGSVIYGSDALGGVMDFQTLSTSYVDSGNYFKGNVLARYSSANNELTPHIDFSFGSSKISSVTSISYSQFSDLRMGKNGREEYLRNDYVETTNGEDRMMSNGNGLDQKFTGYSSYAIMQKIGYKLSERINFDYSFIYSNTSNIPRYDRLIQRKNEDTLKFARWDYGPQRWMMNNLSMNVNAPNGAFDNLKVTLAFQNFEESRISRKFGSSSEKNQIEQVDMYSANFDFDNALSGRSTLYYGIEFIYNKVRSNAVSRDNGEEKPIMTRYPDNSKYMSNAAYVNFQVNHSRRTTFVFGLRYNQILIDATLDTAFYKNFDNNEIDQNTGALTGSLGVAHRPDDSWQMNMNFSSGFKAPNIDDIAKVFDSQPGNVIVPNPDLKPEYLYSVDGLLSKAFGSDQKYKFELSGFYSFLVDAMVQRAFQVNGQDSIIYDGELSQVQAIVNTGSAKISGASLNIYGEVNKNWKWKGGITYTYGKDNEGKNLRHVTPVFANAHLIYEFKKVRIDAYVNYNGAVTNKKMAPSELLKPHIYVLDDNGGLYSPDWYTINLRSAIYITKKSMLTLSLENITNQRYRAYSSGIVGPGFNFIASLKATI